MADQTMPIAPGPNDISTTETAQLLNTSTTTIKRLAGGGTLEPKRVVTGGGLVKVYYDRDKVLELARTWQPDPSRVRNTKAIDRRAAELSRSVAVADGRAATPPPKPKRKPKPKLRAALTRSAPAPTPAPAPSVDEGKRLINALAMIQELYGKSDSEVGGDHWAALRAWAQR